MDYPLVSLPSSAKLEASQSDLPLLLFCFHQAPTLFLANKLSQSHNEILEHVFRGNASTNMVEK